MGGGPSFRTEYESQNELPEFNFLIRPTIKEYDKFVGLLDKILSENIDKSFFGDKVPLEREEKRQDGKIVVIQKGTISLVEEFLEGNFQTPQPELTTEIIEAFKKVRKLRQPQAHAIREDDFVPALFEEQRELVKSVLNAVSLLRQVFGIHPAAKEIKADKDIEAGDIWIL